MTSKTNASWSNSIPGSGARSGLLARCILLLTCLAWLIPLNAGYAADTIFSENFESAWPGLWVVGNNNANTVAKWGDNNAKAATGGWSGFCADNGTNSRTTYDNDLNTYMQRRNISLQLYRNTTLTFKYWMNTESTFDTFQVNLRDQAGTWHSIMSISGNQSSSGWQTKTLNLSAYDGQSGLYISFDFVSDGSVVPAGVAGVWIDDIALTGTKLSELSDGGSHTVNRTTVYATQTFAMSLQVPSFFAASGAHVTKFYFSTNNVISSSDSLVGQYSSSGIPQDAYQTQNISVAFPGTISPGTYYIGCLIDANNQVPEIDETNNTVLFTQQVTVISPPPAAPTGLSVSSTAVTAGNGVSFNWNASSGATSYDWQMVGPGGNTYTSTGQASTTTAHATDSSYVGSWAWQVRANNATGNSSWVSGPSFTVGLAPSISSQPTSRTVTGGTTTTFSVTASGTGTLSYQWKQNGSNVGTNSSSYTIASVQSSDAGSYTVTVTNAYGTITSATATLTVGNAAPVIDSGASASPNPVNNASTTTVSVTAHDPDSGPSALTYTWSTLSGPGTVSFAPNSTTASDVSTASFPASGTYTLQVSVSDGSASTTSQIAGLSVTLAAGAPTITTQPTNQTVTEPTSATFSVVAANATSYQWRRNGSNIPGATASYYNTGATSNAGDNGALFSVVVTNASGSITSNTVTLTVNPTGGGGITPDAYEPDAPWTSAGSITSGATQNRSIDTNLDNDYVAFTLTQASDITITTGGLSGDSEMYLYVGGVTTQAGYNDNYGVGGWSQINLTNQPAGTYYILVQSKNQASTFNYTLSLTVAPATGTGGGGGGGGKKKACAIASTADPTTFGLMLGFLALTWIGLRHVCRAD